MFQYNKGLIMKYTQSFIFLYHYSCLVLLSHTERPLQQSLQDRRRVVITLYEITNNIKEWTINNPLSVIKSYSIANKMLILWISSVHIFAFSCIIFNNFNTEVCSYIFIDSNLIVPINPIQLQNFFF